MKVLIWVATIFVIALIQVLLQSAGIVLGGIPTAILFVGGVAAARALCKSVDEKKGEEQKDNE